MVNDMLPPQRASNPSSGAMSYDVDDGDEPEIQQFSQSSVPFNCITQTDRPFGRSFTNTNAMSHNYFLNLSKNGVGVGPAVHQQRRQVQFQPYDTVNVNNMMSQSLSANCFASFRHDKLPSKPADWTGGRPPSVRSRQSSIRSRSPAPSLHSTDGEAAAVNGVYVASSGMHDQGIVPMAAITTRPYSVQSGGSAGSTIAAALGKNMVDTMEWLKRAYPTDSSNSAKLLHDKFSTVIAQGIEAEELQANQTGRDWGVHCAFALLHLFGMTPRSITQRLRLTVLCGNYANVAEFVGLKKPVATTGNKKRNTKLKPAQYIGVLYLHPKERPSSSDEFLHSPYAFDKHISHSMLSLPVHRFLTVAECREAVAYIVHCMQRARGSGFSHIISAEDSDKQQVLIACENADLLLHACAIAASYVHVLQASDDVLCLWPLTIPRRLENEEEEDNELEQTQLPSDIDGAYDANGTLSMTDEAANAAASSDSTAAGRCLAKEQEPEPDTELCLFGWEHVFQVVPEIVQKLLHYFAGDWGDACPIHPRFFHATALCTADYLRKNYSLNDRMTYTPKASDSGSVDPWAAVFGEIQADLTNMAVQWASVNESLADQHGMYLLNGDVAVVRMANWSNTDRRLVNDFEPTHVLRLSLADESVMRSMALPELVNTDRIKRFYRSAKQEPKEQPSSKCMCDVTDATTENLSFRSNSDVLVSTLGDVKHWHTIQLFFGDPMLQCDRLLDALQFICDALNHKGNRLLLVLDANVPPIAPLMLVCEYMRVSITMDVESLLCALSSSLVFSHLTAGVLLDGNWKTFIGNDDQMMTALALLRYHPSLYDHIRSTQPIWREQCNEDWCATLVDKHESDEVHQCDKMAWHGFSIRMMDKMQQVEKERTYGRTVVGAPMKPRIKRDITSTK